MKSTRSFIFIFTSVCSCLYMGCSDSGSDSGTKPQPEIPSPDELVSCAGGSACPDNTTCVDDLCLVQVEPGQKCDPQTTVCLNGECKDGKCQRTATPSVVVCNGITCKSGQACYQGWCTNAVGEGESCSSANPCKTGYMCDPESYVCKTASFVGDPCDKNHLCRIGTCKDSTCQIVSEEDELKNTDSDGDTISDFYDRCDSFSNPADKSKPDCQSKDSDGDTLPDSVEARNNGDIYEPPVMSNYADYDFMNPDVDANGIPDGKEAGSDLARPADTDGDTVPDYISEDNDGDSIRDEIEIEGVKIKTGDVLHYGRKCDAGCTCGSDGYCAAGTASSPWDSDANHIPDYLSFDSDSDTIPDIIEGTDDSDSDGTADRYSPDSDGDTIPDKDEVTVIDGKYIVQVNIFGIVLKTKDNQTILRSLDGSKYYKQDSSGNISELPDSEKPAQSFSQPSSYCISNDCTYCYKTKDCDQDGILDKNEYTCPGFGWSGAKDDTDGDGFYDMAEIAAAEYAIANQLSVNGKKIEKTEDVLCDPKVKVTDFFDFYFELPYGDSKAKEADLEFLPTVSKLDVVFNMDTTSSMDLEIANLKDRIRSFIIPELRSRVADTGIGVTHFDDFPTNGYGASSANDWPFVVDGLISMEDDVIKANIDKLEMHGGADPLEAGMEGLWHILKGDDKSYPLTSWTAATANDKAGKLDYCAPPANTWGCVGFREKTLPVIVTITDQRAHNSDAEPYNTQYVKNPHYSSDVIAAANDKGARIISVSAKQHYQYPQLKDVSRESKAVVPLCAFQNIDKTWKCGEKRCCTGTENDGNGTYPESGEKCVLSYGVENASNMSSTMIDGIDALIKYGTYDVSTKVIGNALPNGKTTACFIKRVVASRYVAPPNPPESFCNPVAQPTKVVAADFNDGFTNFAPGKSSQSQKGAELHFTVNALNDDCVEATDHVQIFEAYIDVINPTTGLSFGTRTVSIIVPAKSDQGDN